MIAWLASAVVWVIGFVLVIAAVAYAVLPLAIKATQYSRAASGYEAVGRHELPPDVLAFMDRSVWELQALGFSPAALVREVGAVPDVTIYVVMLYNPTTYDRCAAAVTRSDGVVNLSTPTVTFETKFEDGTTIETGNFADAGVFPADPKVRRLNIPNLNNVPLQCEIHQRRRAKYAPAARAWLPPQGRELEMQIQEEAQEKERVRAAGYYYLDAAAGKYRTTWKGAYLMTWKLLIPVSMIRRQAKRMRARRELSELGLDPRLLDAPPPPPVPLMPVPVVPMPADMPVPVADDVAPPNPPPVPQRPTT